MWTLRGLVLLGLLAASYQRSRPTHYENTFATGDELELRVYLSEQLRFKDFNNSAALIWHATGMRYDMSSAGDIETTVQVNVTQHMLNNGSMYCHSFFTKAGKSPDPKALGSYDRWSSTHTIMSMVAHAERLKPIGLYNLLTGEPAPWETALRNAADEAAAAGVPEGQFIPYWKPKMHLQLVVDATPFPMDAMPNLMHNALHQSGLMQGHRYRPFVYVNELTVMKAHWAAVNATAATVPLEISAKPLKAEHFQWMVNLKHSFAMQEEQLGISEKESEELRGMFVHTNPVLLYTTVAVSAFHLLFDCLAFKSDLSFWNSVDTMEGLSSRTVLLNQVMEVVILLYLINEDASWLVKISSLFTLVLGCFKIVKSLSVKKQDEAKAVGGVSLTDQIDRLAFRYLAPPMLLLVVAYAGYCLVYSYFKGWYSWILECLVALVYGGGFIVMTPQLFINYRLKSVACLPWKFFMYKALNTFIDDLFAFIIKMPTLHRAACFRDDIVFMIFLYQRWVYKVDHSRVNEFGQRGEGGEGGEGTEETPTDGKGDGKGGKAKAKKEAPHAEAKEAKEAKEGPRRSPRRLAKAEQHAESDEDAGRELSAAELKAVKKKGAAAAKAEPKKTK